MKIKTLAQYIRGKNFKVIGEVSDDTLQHLIEYVSYNKNPVVIIHSSGGNAASAQAMHDILRSCEATTIALNCVQSAAFTIFMGGKYRLSTENALFMIHKAYAFGDYLDAFIENYIIKKGQVYYVNEGINRILNRIGEKLPRLKMSKKYFNAQQMLKKGAVNEIII